MANLFNNESLKIKYSKTNLPIPVINEVHLHSIYDPIKEAQSLIKQNFDLFKNNDHILIFGLGMGYHVIELLKEYELNHLTCQILVIEPIEIVFKTCVEYNSDILNSNIKIISNDSIFALYQERELIDFLIKRPIIFQHPPSLNLHNNFFKKFFSYKASNKIGDFLEILQEKDLVQFFSGLDTKLNLSEVLDKSISKNNIAFQEIDFLLHALDSISPLSSQKELGSDLKTTSQSECHL